MMSPSGPARRAGSSQLGGDFVTLFDVSVDGFELDLAMASSSLEESDAALIKNLVEERARHPDQASSIVGAQVRSGLEHGDVTAFGDEAEDVGKHIAGRPWVRRWLYESGW
jgi:hypothetical protein